MYFLNGFLPCGLVYAGLVGSLVAGSWSGGVLYMMIFGLGTLPLLVIFNIFISKIKLKNQKLIIMTMKAKYQSVLDLGESLNIQNGDVSEENGVLKVKGTANTPYEKNIIWDKIKEIGGDNLGRYQIFTDSLI